ncbi:MAG: hypothetical protein MZV64_18040 [Ignavibacteriales bacterium]|nr:hypothetical protein [Ignavibacteriales bacterium]
MRVTSAVFVLLSVVLAYLRPATIVAILSISWGAIGSFFLGPFVWGLVGKQATKSGAIGLGHPRPRDVPGPGHRRDVAGRRPGRSGCSSRSPSTRSAEFRRVTSDQYRKISSNCSQL